MQPQRAHGGDGPDAVGPLVDTQLIDLAEVGGSLAACDLEGRVTSCSPSARQLLRRMVEGFDHLPAPLPPSLWRLVSAQAVGEAIQWRPSEELLLGCTRYALGVDRWLLVMSEISHKQNLLSQRLHQQRLEALGRLVATTAHDLRSPLSSIVFNSVSLEARIEELPPERVREAAGDIKTAASRLRATIDCLLDYVRMGPPRPSEVTIAEVLGRLKSLLRPLLKAGGHRLVDVTSHDADCVRGNVIAIEQIFVNLVLNSIEAAGGPATVRISSSHEGERIRFLVEDDGPGIADEDLLHVFDPFFTTKRDGTGLGLSTARESARAAGGDIELVRGQGGAAFAVYLPAHRAAPEGPR